MEPLVGHRHVLDRYVWSGQGIHTRPQTVQIRNEKCLTLTILHEAKYPSGVPTVGRFACERRALAARHHIRRKVEVCDLTPCVHPGVSPTRADDPHWATQDGAECLGEFALHRPAAGLHLPPGEVRAIVLKIDAQSHAHHMPRSTMMAHAIQRSTTTAATRSCVFHPSAR